MDSVRRTLDVRRVGHTGTLDPFATGLLQLLVGRATRLSQYLAGLDKEYTGIIRLGETTDTDDLTGRVLERDESWNRIDDARVREVMQGSVGRIPQRPPSFSARQVGGERAYRLARRGHAVALEVREVAVYEFEMLERSGCDIVFHCRVSSGTYIRALARDVGAALGCGAHLQSLRRLSIGSFSVEHATPLRDVTPDNTLEPPVMAVTHLPQLAIDQDQRSLVRHGRPISAIGSASPVALVIDGALVAIAEREGEWLKPKVVLET